MIDWLTIRLESSYSVQAGVVMSVDADGVIEWRTPKRQMVEGSHSSRVSIRNVHDHLNLEISGNPAKFLQGHNLFGSDDMMGLCRAFVLRVLELIGHRPAPLEYGSIEAGVLYLTRVDLNVNSDFGNTARALAAIRALSEQAYLRNRGRGSLTQESTLYFGKNSRRWSIKMYAKGAELKAHPLASNIEFVTELGAYASGLLRREVTIRGMQLKEMGLNYACQWENHPHYSSPRSVFDSLASKVNITEAILPELRDHQAIPQKLRAAFVAWSDGHDLREIYSRRTFYRYRAELLKYGIDVAICNPKEPTNVVRLVTVLEGHEVGVPDWARGTPLYFEPRARAA